MKSPHFNLRLIFSGDTVLLVFSVVLLLASLSEFTHWPELRAFRVFGVLTLLFSPVFLILSCLELVRYQRRIRTILSAIGFLAATVISLIALLYATGHIR